MCHTNSLVPRAVLTSLFTIFGVVQARRMSSAKVNDPKLGSAAADCRKSPSPKRSSNSRNASPPQKRSPPASPPLKAGTGNSGGGIAGAFKPGQSGVVRRDHESLSDADIELLTSEAVYTPAETELFLNCLSAHTVDIPLSGTGKRVVYSLNVRSLWARDYQYLKTVGGADSKLSHPIGDSKKPVRPPTSPTAPKWECGACTYINAGSANKCGMCDGTNKKPIASAAPPPTASGAGGSGAGSGGGASAEAGDIKASGSTTPPNEKSDSSAIQPPSDLKLPAPAPTATDSKSSSKVEPPATSGGGAVSAASKKVVTVLMLHGFGASCTWAAWTKMILPIIQASHASASASAKSQSQSQSPPPTTEYNFIMIDLPGFGESSGRDTQTIVWRNDAPGIIRSLLVYGFGVESNVSVIGHCGGAATFFRTFIQYPELFSKRNQIAHNCIIAQWPKEFDSRIVSNGCRLLVTWCEDNEHMRWCVSHKHLSQIASSKNTSTGIAAHLDFVDVNPEVLRETGIKISSQSGGWGRGGVNTAYVFYPSIYYIDQAVAHITHKPGPRCRALFEPQCVAEKLSAMDIIHNK